MDSLAAQELIDRQRFRLFTITTLTAGIVIGIAFAQSVCVMESGVTAKLTSLLIGLLAIGLVVNYVSLPFHRNHRFSYYTIVLAAFITLHLISYSSGGIRASAIMYLAGNMLLAYMLLGNKAGRIVFALSAIHIVYFWYITGHTDWVQYDLIGKDEWSINLDYMSTWLFAMLILSAQMNFLESGKNEVISRITEQRNELTLKNRELNKLSTVASKAENAIVITDANGRIEWVNDGFMRLTHLRSSHILGLDILTVYTPVPGLSDNALKELSGALGRHASFTGELQIARKDGTRYWIQLNATPIQSDEDGSSQFILIGTDITERKMAEEQTLLYMRNLEKTNAELDKFAYVVSHDLKAPLRAIGSLTGWIEEDMGQHLPEDMRKHLTTIQGRVVRMEGLINGILDYTKAAKKEEDRVIFDVAEMVQETVDLLGPPQGVRITITGDWSRIFARKVKMQQVFINLIQNALKYNNKSAPEIAIGCRLTTGGWEFYVQDNGPGIEPRYHQKIFEIFQTLNARDEVESRGVGLAIVKKLVEEEGGSIRVESELGMGASFVVFWPESRDETVPVSNSSNVHQSSGTNRA
ncbi:MAG: sensor histidine kinase [Bacteroidota bacterium]